MLERYSVGFVVLKDDGTPLRTQGGGYGRIGKLYDKVGKAKAIVTKYGQGSVYEAFVDLGMHPIYVAPLNPKQQPKAKVPYGD